MRCSKNMLGSAAGRSWRFWVAVGYLTSPVRLFPPQDLPAAMECQEGPDRACQEPAQKPLHRRPCNYLKRQDRKSRDLGAHNELFLGNDPENSAEGKQRS